MGLFGRNWDKELRRAEDLLRREQPVQALEIAQRAARKAGPEVRDGAAELVTRARAAVVASVLAKAAAAEADGNLADAADWLLAAIEQEPGADRRRDLEARRQALLDRAEDAHGPWRVPAGAPGAGSDETAAADVDFQYETLVAMLGEEIGGLYQDRPMAFKQAFVDLNEGRTAVALEAFEGLAEAAGEDPVVRLERGRARLLSGDAEGARDDLAEAWKALDGAPPGGDTSRLVATLWAEAALAAGRAPEVAERLAPLVSQARGDAELDRLYATALLGAGHLDRAVAHLEAVLALRPGDADLSLLLAQALAGAGHLDRAIAGLELAIAPSCAAGGCGRPAVHVPSFRFLARLHLERGEGLDRARELMAMIANARQGRLESQDLEILATYYGATGDPAAAEDAAAEARRLAGSGDGGTVDIDSVPRAGRIL